MGTKHRLKVIFLIIYTTLLSFSLNTACKDEDEACVRNFMPVSVEFSQDGINNATLKWRAVNNTASYTVQLYSDDNYQTLISENKTAIPQYTFTGLSNKQTYYYQIRSNNYNPEYTSKWQRGKFTFSRETILNDPEFYTDSIKVTWNRLIESLSHITVNSGANSTIHYLTQEELVNQSFVIRNALPSTSYTIKLYIDTTLIDAITFTTKQNVTNTIYISPNDNLIDVINNCANGSVIHLAEGIYAYGDKEITIKDKSLIIESNSTDEENYPEVHIKKFSLKGNVGNFIIKNIALTGFALGGKSPNEKNDYFIDLNSDFEKADSIIISGCTIHYLNNCAIRGSRGLGKQSVKYIEFTDCEFNDINSEGKNQYELFKLDSLQISDFILKNCTIYNTSHGLVNNRNNHTGNVNIVIENCTINDVGSTSSVPKKYLLEFNKTAGLFTFKNNIVSNLKGFDKNESSMSKGFSLGNLISNATNNLFYNMPFTVQEVTNWTNSSDNYDDINPQYEDESIGNFTITNEKQPVLKTIGATKWR